MYKKFLSGVVFAIALVFGNSTSAAVVNWSFNSGTTTSASATDGTFSATITVGGTQGFTYPDDSYLSSAAFALSNTVTLDFSEAINELSFDIGSLDDSTHESVDFGIIPTLTAVSGVDWTVGGPAILVGTLVTHNTSGDALLDNNNSGRVSFTGLDGITSFTFTEKSTDNSYAIYYDNFSATVVPIPSAVLLFASGLLGLVGLARRKALA